MGMLNKLTTFIAIISSLVGIFLSPIPRNLGLYRYAAKHIPQLIGLTPAFHHGIDWNYTYNELYSTCHKIRGQKAIVTGANSGVGFETCKALAKCGVHVTMVCRNPIKCSSAAKQIKDIINEGKCDIEGSTDCANIITMTADMSSLKSVKSFSKKYLEIHKESSLDMLYLNAGIPARFPGDSFQVTEDGIETIFATNYVGHHLMYRLLEPLILRSKMARIIQTSSAASFDSFPHKVATSLSQLNVEGKYDPADMAYYGQSKLAQILWTKHLTNLLETSGNSNVYVNSLHPGAVATSIWDNLYRDGVPKFLKDFLDYAQSNVMWTCEEGALTQLFLGVAVDRIKKDSIRGKYFHPQVYEVTNHHALNETLQQELWDFSNELISEFL